MTADTAVSQQADTLATLREQRLAWESRPLLRLLYTSWFRDLEKQLSPGPGPTVELGAGCGGFKEFMPTTIATDVIATPWADQVVDAETLPFEDATVANLVLVDVLHHLAHPRAALEEAERTLAPGGRLVMLEPYCAPLSALAYRVFHHEELDWEVDPENPMPPSSGDPFDANIALPTLLFWRRRELIEEWAPKLRVVQRRRLAWLAYPLSGGFSRPPLLPLALARPALALERLAAPVLGPLAAFRCLIVLERM